MARNKRSGGWLVPTAIVAVLAGVLGSGAMVWSASNAAFSGTTVNPSNTWAAGAVSLTDDDAGVAMFTATGLTPASTPPAKCIAVTYGGSVTAPVKLYGATPTGTGLETYLNFTIEIGTSATFASCAGFVTGSTLYTGTLATFASTYTNYSNGLATWSPTGAAQTKAFRFTYTVANNNTANGLTCGMPFTWEAQA
jgi:hypothetical protein